MSPLPRAARSAVAPGQVGQDSDSCVPDNSSARWAIRLPCHQGGAACVSGLGVKSGLSLPPSRLLRAHGCPRPPGRIPPKRIHPAASVSNTRMERSGPGPLHRTGGMWTPTFPTIAGAQTARGGVPLTTLDVKHVMSGADVVVTVSLFYGGPGKNGVEVATVRVTPAEPVRVAELRPTVSNRSSFRSCRLPRRPRTLLTLPACRRS